MVPKVEDENDDDDDGLGYYFDGVKRTLTDEQVAMFRHSEVHALIRERGARRDQSNGRGDTDMVDARTEEGEDEREEMEYAAFLVRERQELSMQGQVGEVDYGREEESSRGAHRKDAKTPDWQRQRRKQVSYADIDEGEINPDGGGDIPDSKGADGGNAKTFAWPRIGG
ncbi:MAG: hypothetical protein M1832_004116 [Thelocarpon impressellum]|nr:MAG: hypothetical protein M1832_004116 [Thelocarpon impressellum]